MAKKDENDVLDEGRRLQAEAVAAQEARDKHTPTPTQEEVDRAKLGEDVELAPSGVPETKADAAEKPAASYKTRSASAD